MFLVALVAICLVAALDLALEADAILVELLTRHLDASIAITRRRRDELPESLEEIVRVFVRTAIENHLDDPQLLRVMIEQAPRSSELLERIFRQEQALVATARAVATALHDRPELLDLRPGVAASGEVDRILKSLGRADLRIWIVDRQERLLAITGDLRKKAAVEPPPADARDVLARAQRPGKTRRINSVRSIRSR
jgi:hypothetical protein